MPNLTILESSVSTNTELASTAPHGWAVMAKQQTAGRGQRGNHWESASGKNVTMSIMLRPEELKARNQFLVSEAVALGVRDTVLDYVKGHQNVRIKWPNDIYVDDKKIAGILIENAVSGGFIKSSIAGIGLNVNQAVFFSDAPNPISIFQLTAVVNDIEFVARNLLDKVMERMEHLGTQHEEYFSHLYHNDNFYPYRDCLKGDTFLGSIKHVAPDGRLTLRLPSGEERGYYFKEVAFL